MISNDNGSFVFLGIRIGMRIEDIPRILEKGFVQKPYLDPTALRYEGRLNGFEAQLIISSNIDRIIDSIDCYIYAKKEPLLAYLRMLFPIINILSDKSDNISFLSTVVFRFVSKKNSLKLIYQEVFNGITKDPSGGASLKIVLSGRVSPSKKLLRL